MPLPFRKKGAYKKQRRRRAPEGRGQRRAARLGRIIVIVIGAILLILPTLLLADPISYVPLIMVVLMVVISWVYLRIVDHAVSVGVTSLEYACERGEDAGLSVTLANRSPLPVPRVELRFTISDLFGGLDDERMLTCSLAPFETVEAQFDANFPHLGTYEAGIREVIVHDLLGIFSRRHEDGTMNNVVVRPAKVDLGGTNATEVMPDDSSRMLKPIPSDNEDYASVREYHRGDPMKTVHWNLSSRNPEGKLYTRLFEEYVNPSLVIIIDHVSPEYDADTLMSLFDGMVECAAGLSAQARAAGVDAEVRFLNHEGEPSTVHLVTDDDANDLVSALHRITPHDDADGGPSKAEEMLRAVGLQNHGFGNIAFVTSRAEENCLTSLVDIRVRRRNAMAFVAVPRDLEGRDYDRFWAPFIALGSSGVPFYAVESTPMGTEVHGL